jgi:hypothetical protein
VRSEVARDFIASNQPSNARNAIVRSVPRHTIRVIK